MRPYKTTMYTIRGPMVSEADNLVLAIPDPVVDMIAHNVGKLQTAHAFKMAGIVHPARDKAEERMNSNIRSYRNTLHTAAGSLDWLEREYTGKEFRKEVHAWARTLYKDGRQKVLSFSGTGNTRAEGRAYMDVSKAIIDAFKEL